MCGAMMDADAFRCTQCGEEMQTSPESLTVPLFSPTAIGVCTFFWTHITGMLLVWLNCRRLALHDAALKTLLLGIAMTAGYIALLFVLPDANLSGLIVALVSVVIVTNYAKSVLKEPFAQQQQQRGPYRSVWVGHGIGCLVIMVLVAVVIGILMLLGIAGIPIE